MKSNFRSVFYVDQVLYIKFLTSKILLVGIFMEIFALVSIKGKINTKAQ